VSDDPRENAREMFLACAEIVREHGREEVPLEAVALAFGVSWSLMSDETAARYFDDLARGLRSQEDSALVQTIRRRPGDGRRFRAWFS